MTDQTPEHAAPEAVGKLPQHAYTPWSRRLVALTLDAIPVVALFALGQFALLFKHIECRATISDGYANVCHLTVPSGTRMAITASALLAAMAYTSWNWGYRQGTTGASLGKSALKFRVVSEKTGLPVGFRMSIVRQLSHVLDAVTCYIGYLRPLWDPKRQTFADKINSTVCLPTARHDASPDRS